MTGGKMCADCAYCARLWWLNWLMCTNDESGYLGFETTHHACGLFEERGQ